MSPHVQLCLVKESLSTYFLYELLSQTQLTSAGLLLAPPPFQGSQGSWDCYTQILRSCVHILDIAEQGAETGLGTLRVRKGEGQLGTEV